MRNSTKFLLPILVLAGLVACGGGGGGSTDKPNTTSSTGTVNYSQPTGNPGQPVIALNSGLSTNTLLVFDVVGESATTMTRGVVLNLQVDNGKLQPVEVPGTLSPVLKRQGIGIDSAGFGGGNAVLVRQDKADGTTLLVSAIRNPNAAVPCSGSIVRFAYQIQGTPVSGVIRAQVLSGSGLLDGTGRVINGTSPALGRLEIK